MRCNQVSINIERFGKHVPKDYPADNQCIHVYCDDFDSIYAALSKAYAMAINELNEYDHIGARCDVTTNEFSHVDYRKMNSTIPIVKRKYGQDFDFQYNASAQELYKDFIWAYEHRNEIVDAISDCESESEFAPRLKEKFNLNDVQVRKLSQIRLDMLTKERYEDAKASLEKASRAWKKWEKSGDGLEEKITWERHQVNVLKREIENLEAYFMAAEHYKEILDIIMDDNLDYYKEMQERFEFDREQSRAIKYFCPEDFSKRGYEEQEKKLKRLKEHLEYDEERLKDDMSKMNENTGQ